MMVGGAKSRFVYTVRSGFTAIPLRQIRLLSLVFLLLLLTPGSSRAAVVDQGFNPNVNGIVRAIAVQDDGKVVIGGDFTSIGGVTRNYLARLNSDGSLDTTFERNPSNQVRAIAIQPDRKILIGGFFSSVGGVARSFIARLNPDGTLDAGFSTNLNGQVNAIVLQPDRKILVSGGFSTAGGVNRHMIARLHPDGSLDTGFADPIPDGTWGVDQVYALARQPDGKILAGGNLAMSTRENIFRLNPDGNLDPTFNEQSTDQYVECLAVQPDGKVLVGGWFDSVGAATTGSIARLHSDGTLDSAFNPDVGQGVTDIAIQPDGKILIGGEFFEIGGDMGRSNLARLNPDGSLDATAFAPAPYYYADGYVRAFALQPDGRILVGGSFTEMGGVTRNHVARFNPDGSLETPFSPTVGGAYPVVYGVALQPDGKILVGGDFTTIAGGSRTGIARLNRDGSLDTTFTPGAYSYVVAIAVQPDGKIVIGGAFTIAGGAPRNRLARLNSDGSLDTTFSDADPDGDVNAIAMQSDGKILVGGSFGTIGGGTRGRLARLNSNGSLDNSFNDPGANNYVMAVATQPDGKIVVGGSFNTVRGETRQGIARLNADGTLDSIPNIAVNKFVYAIVVQPDGKIVIGGSFDTIGGVPRERLARLNTDGTRDATFNPTATCSTANCSVFTMALQPDDKIVIGGSFETVSGQQRHAIARLNSNGSLDTTVNVDVSNGWVNSLAPQADGRILMGGSFSIDLGNSEYIRRLARLADTGTAVQDLWTTSDGRGVGWTRGGGGPELNWTTFESSTDQAAWSLLNYGHRVGVQAVWDLFPLSLPRDQILFIRARGYYSNSASCSIIEQVKQFYLTNRPPVITLHPVSKTVTEGNSVSFSSQAEGYPQPTVKWQVYTGSSWSDISGATSNVYTHAATASENNYQYRAVFANFYNSSEHTTASDPATLRVMRNQTITVNDSAPPTAAYNTTFAVNATASSSLPVAITSSGSCTGSGSGSATIRMSASSGTCTVHYNQSGNANYNPASEVTNSTTAQKSGQTIDFPVSDKVLGSPPFTVSATASSGLPVSFSEQTPTVCSVSGSTVTLLTAGTCTVRASQGGNVNYNPAQVDGSFTVGTIQLSVSPSSWLFGVEQLGNCASSRAVTFTVKNSGTSSCTLGTLAIGGPDAGQFSFGNNGCTGQVLNAGSSCTVDVKFCPTSVGSKAANLLIPSDDPQTPTLAAFLYNHESPAEEARRRLPPVLYGLNVPEEMIEGQQYTLTWSLLGYDESYRSNIVFFNCNGVPAGTCGGAYGNHFDESGDLDPQDSEPGEWTYSGVQSTKFNFTYNFTAPVVTADTTIVIRFYSTDQADVEAGKVSLSLLIPGGLSNTYYDSEGRRLVKIIKNQ